MHSQAPEINADHNYLPISDWTTNPKGIVPSLDSVSLDRVRCGILWTNWVGISRVEGWNSIPLNPSTFTRPARFVSGQVKRGVP